MSRRTLAGVIAAPLAVALWLVTLLLPVPYVRYQPGLTVDVLAEEQGKEIVQVTGHPAYHDNGELRMTTVYVTRPNAKLNIYEALLAWISDTEAIYPYSAVYGKGETEEQSETESSVQMVSSQDAAVATALKELGYDVKPVIEVLNVADDLPAHDKLQVRDVILSVNGTKITTSQQVVDKVKAIKAGQPVTFVVRRGGKPHTVSIVPKDVDGTPKVGIITGPGYVFPFQVDIGIPDAIGGPSAGLMFSLAIYDTLTPGSLTGGKIVAGTGTIDDKGQVGPIGGIQQKIAAAQQAKAELFLVPADNCSEALGAPDDGMRLVKVTTMHDAMQSVKAWVRDPGTPLPSCEGS